MGNHLSSQPVDYHLSDIGLIQQAVLPGGRFLKTLKCVHDEGWVVLKIFFKEKSGPTLQRFDAMLLDQKRRLQSAPGLLPWLKFFENARAGYLIRQYFAASLTDRLSTRPFLTLLEKQWIAFQLLMALQHAHAAGFAHGDVKSQNVMVTTWNWVYLTDFAPFKPVTLPEDNPADFNFYFAGGRQSCYLAPERFTASGTPPPYTELHPSMDIFSLGCVIAEMFLEGQSVFSFEELLRYRRGLYSPESTLNEIEIPAVREMVAHMIQTNPASRLSAAEYIAKWNGKAFPTYFEALHAFLRQMSHKDPDEKITIVARELPHILRAIAQGASDTSHWAGFDTSALVIIASIVTSSIRNVRSGLSKLQALDLLSQMALLVSDSVRLERILPHEVLMLSAVTPAIRAKAVRAVTTLLCAVKNVPFGETRVFLEFVLPAMQMLPTDNDDAVRLAVAENLALLAEAGRRFLETAQTASDGTGSLVEEDALETSYDADLAALLQGVLQLVQPFVTDQCEHVKRALLSDITRLCGFFGLPWTNDHLLPMLITFLNDRSWELRWQFFDSIVGVSSFVGRSSLRSFLLPCITQALNDEEEFVIEKALRTLASLAELGLFHKGALVEVTQRLAPLMCHPNTWIRYAVVGFLVATAKQLSVVDVHCFILPVIQSYMTRKLAVVSELSLMEAMVGPVSRKSYDAAIRAMAEFLDGAKREARQPIHDPVPDDDQRKLRLMEDYMRTAAQSLHNRLRTTDDDQARLLPPSLAERSVPLGDPPAGPPLNMGSLMRREGQAATQKPLTGELLNNWRPRGVIVANFTEHKSAVNALAASRDNLFFVSGSDDGTVKVWDCQRLEKNVTNHSRLTYTAQSHGGTRITSVCICENSHSVASGGSNGSVHVFRVEVAPTSASQPNQPNRYSGFTQINQMTSDEGAILFVQHYNTLSESLVIFATQVGSIQAWDLRSRRIVWSLRVPGSIGLITAMVLDPQHMWLLVGTRRGYMQLWDIRFALAVLTFRHPSCSPIHRLVLSSTGPASRILVICASGENEVTGWDLTGGKCLHLFRVLPAGVSPQSVPDMAAGLEPELGDYAVHDLHVARDHQVHDGAGKHNAQGMRALFVAQDAGYILTGGDDRKLRYWDMRSVAQSFIVSGAQPDEKPQYSNSKIGHLSLFQEVPGTDQTRRREESAQLPPPQLPSAAHSDSITDIIGLELPMRMLVSSSRDGVVKVWR